jgi:long-chain acyl-CoA synthetase
VHEAVVFPVDDERWGQMVCAAVVGPVTDADLRAHGEARRAP